MTFGFVHAKIRQFTMCLVIMVTYNTHSVVTPFATFAFTSTFFCVEFSIPLYQNTF
jgi:hypothetical protein